MYQKLSKLLVVHDLHAKRLRLRANQAWDLTLTNGLKLKLGKRDLELRLRRFCQAYPAVFADKHEQLSSVDLRYARGMAVQWNQQTGR
jgi:cell division protein FtsQ